MSTDNHSKRKKDYRQILLDEIDEKTKYFKILKT